MKLISLIINGRIEKIINFDKPDNSSSHYIIDCTNDMVNQKVKLFELNRNYVVSENGNKTITLIQTKGQDGSYCFEVNEGRAQRGNDPVIDFEITVDDKVLNTRKEVKFKYNKVEKTLSFYFAQNIYDVVVDFGSESSQVAWRNRQGAEDHRTNVVNGLLNSYASPKDGETDQNNSAKLPQENSLQTSNNAGEQNKIKPKNYVQYESDELYRSIYYIKKTQDLEYGDDSWPKYSSDFIQYLTKRSELDTIKAEYIQLPNPKFQMFSNIPSPKIAGGRLNVWEAVNGKVPRILLNNIICQTLNDIAAYSDEQKIDQYAVNIVLLMPNVYPPHVVSKKTKELVEDLNQKKDEWKGFSDFELGMVSESDASMLGYYSYLDGINQSLKGGDYIIFDAGKGTLDFSIIKVDNKGETLFSSKSRSGIVGAGNAITYAVLVSLLGDFLSMKCQDVISEQDEDEGIIKVYIKKFIFEKILNSGNNPDLSIVLTLMNSVENYKVFFNECENDNGYDTARGDNQPLLYKDIEIKTFTEWINAQTNEMNGYIVKHKEYIDAEIDNIVSEVMRNLETMISPDGRVGENQENAYDFRGVVFTGRGCLMKRLREKLLEGVKTIIAKGQENKEKGNGNRELDNILPQLGNGASMKNLCLQISQVLNDGKYDFGSGKLEITKITTVVDEDGSKGKGKRKNKNQDSRIRNLEPEIGTFGEVTPTGVRPGRASVEWKTGTCFDGVNLGGRCDKISIGGAVYSFPREENMKIYFDGEDYYFKDSKGLSMFGNSRLAPKICPKLYFESMFPAVVIQNENDVVIPVQPKQDDELFATPNGPEEEQENNENPPAEEVTSQTIGAKISNKIKGLFVRLLNWFFVLFKKEK